MAIYINEEDKKLFEQNGYNQESVGNTVNHYRELGLSDDEIQGKINQRLEGWRTPKQKVTTQVTRANQDISTMSPNDFKRNVDSLYDIPQVDMPARNNAGYMDSDGNVRDNVPTFAENHPIVDSILNRIKQIPSDVANFNNKFSGIGDQSLNINAARGFAAPQYQPNSDTPLLTGGVSKKSFLNDQRYWLKTKANKAGDALLRIASNMGNSNPYGNLQPVQNPVKTTVNENGQKVIDYSKESPMEMKVAGSRADYETLKDIRRNPQSYFSPAHTDSDYVAISNSYKQGKISYEDAKAAWDQFNSENLAQKQKADNAVRVLNEDAERKIQNIEIGEAMLDTAFWGTFALNALTLGGASIPTVGGRIVTGKLKNNIKKQMVTKLISDGFIKKDAELMVAKAAEKGIVDKGVQLGLEQYSKNLLSQYGINGAVGELAGKMATNAALAGTAGAIDMGLLNGAINQYTNYLGVTDNNPLESVVEGAGQGAVFAGTLGGASPVLSQAAKYIGNIPLSKTYEPLPNAVTKYTGKPYQNGMNYVFKPDTDFVMGEGSDLKYPNREAQDVQYNGAEELKQIAPKTMEKIESNPVSERKPKRYKYINGKTVEVLEDGSYKELPNKYSKIAPNIVASKEAREAAKNERVENTEKLQANKFVGQEGNATEDKEWQETLKKRDAVDLEIVARAASTKYGKKYGMREIKMLIGAMRNGNTYKNGLHKRAEKFFEFISQPDDRITSGDKVTTIPNAIDFYSDNMTDEEIINRAINNLLYNRTKPIDPMEKAFEDLEQSTNKFMQNLQNMKSPDETDAIIAEFEKLDEYKSLVDEDYYDNLAKKMYEKFNELEYNNNKGISDEKNNTNDEGENNGQPESDTRTEDRNVQRNDDIRSESLYGSGAEEEGAHQVAIEGLEEESAKAVQKQQDEVIVKENQEKYSTTQGGKQNQMFNVEQFKNGQQMLFDTSDMPKELEVKKTTYTMKSGKEKEIEYVEEVPEGYIEDKGATTAPNGYTWYHNNKSITSGERKRILVKDKTTEESSEVEKDINVPSKKSEPKKNETKKKESGKLEDAGEFLQGNRKQDTSLTWDDLKDMNDLIRAKNTTKARVYPKPSIEDLKSEGFTEFQAGVIQNVYNKINAKPAAGYDKIEHQKQYVDTINEVMSKVKDYIKSHPDEFTTDLIAEAAKKYRSWSYDYNKSLFDAIFPDTENKKNGYYSSIFRLYPEYNRKAIIVGGNKFTGALQLDNKTLADVMKAIEDSKKVKEKGEKVKKADWEKNFIVLEPDRWNKEYAVASKKSKQVLARYATKEDAIAAAERVHEKIERMKAESKKANFERDYIERRENNRDVTTEELQNAFGFRGVNFGNWATAKERQDFANYAYDSLFDLAELLNLPPKAISLNGQLGLAYGAQGHGGKAAAHYIPEYKEINLTKEYGAGSLAHEWWHALDNYFGNQATNKEFSREWALSLAKGGELRPEVYEALNNLQKQIKEAPYTEEDVKRRAEQLTKQTKGRIQRYADSIKQDYAKAQNSAELNKIIDDLVENQEKYKTYSWEDLHEITNKFFKLLPSNRDTITNRGKFSWLTGEITRLNDIDELARKGANKSKYLQNAEKIDKQSGSKYWSEDTELGARAFAVYIFDKMEKQNILNRFLTRGGDGAVINFDAFKELAEGEERESLTISTTPKGEERKRIFDAFDRFFKTLKIRETDKGIELYDVDIPEFMRMAQEVDNGYKDLDLTPIYEKISKGISGEELAKMLPDELGEIIKRNAGNYTFGELTTKHSKSKGTHNIKKAQIKLNLAALGNSPYSFIESIMHEVEHAKQQKMYLQIMSKPKNTCTPEERTFIANYNICKKVNKERGKYYNLHSKLIDKFDKNHFYSEEERAEAISKLPQEEQKIIDTYDRLYENYKNAFFEVNARAEGVKNATGYRKESRYTLSRPAKTEQTDITRPKKWGLLANNWFNSEGGEYSTKQEVKSGGNKNTGDEIKERGAINTLNKYNKEMADSVTDREYIVRGIEKVEKDIANMSEKEIEDILNSKEVSDIKSVALAHNIKDSIKNGEVPISKLNKWASEGTEIGQAMQSRKAIAPETLEEAVIKMHTYNTEKAPKAAKKLLKDADKIVNQIKKSNNEIEKEFDNWLKEQESAIKNKKEYSQDGDKLALLKAMEKYREKKALRDKKAQEKAEAKLAKQEENKRKELEKEEENAKKELEKERQALVKAMEKYRSTKERQAARELERANERKRKAVEKLVEERTIGWNKKKKADLIDNIMKLDENGGLTEDNVCKLINKMFGIKEVTPADIQELKKLEENIKNAKTQREEDIAKGFMQKYILDNSIGATWWDKIDSIRYINMLGSTKSRLLDFASTGVYQAIRLADNASVLVLDKLLTKKIFGTDRVTSGFYPVEYAKGFVQGAKEGYYDVSHGINTGRAGETARYDLNRANAFKYKPLEPLKGFPKFKQGVENSFSVLEKFVSGMVRIPDRAFFNGRYNASLIDQLKARGMKLEKAGEYSGSQLSEYLTNVATQEEIEQAVNEARENVFQRECAASMAAAKIREVANGIVPKSGDILFPFIHTTSVISQDVAERIGLGFVKGLKQIHNIRKNGGSTGQIRDAYNSLAKSITGAIIIMLGVGARLAGKDDDSDKTYSDTEVSGEHSNSLSIGKTSLNAKDIPFLTIPYNLAKALSSGDEEIMYKGILKAFDAISDVNPITSTYKESIKQSNGVKNRPAKDVLTEFIANSLYTPAAQVGQNAMLRDVRGIIDPYQRETFEPDKPFKTAANRFKNSTPFLSKSLPVKYNAVGAPVMKNDGNNLVERAVSGLITGHKHIKRNETYDTYNKTLKEAYKDTNLEGKNNILLQKIKHSIDVNGENYKMSAEEFSDFQRDYGRINYRLRTSLMNKIKNGKNYSDADFVKEINEIQNSALEAVKITQLGHIPKRYKNGNYILHDHTIGILQNYDELIK